MPSSRRGNGVFFIFATIAALSVLRSPCVLFPERLSKSFACSSQALRSSEGSRLGVGEETVSIIPGSLSICRKPEFASTRYCSLRDLLDNKEDAAEEQVARAAQSRYLTACTAVKGAGDTIHEFVIRNYMAGVDHFYIYDDDGKGEHENLAELLAQLSSLVTIIKPPSVDDFLQLVGLEGAYNILAVEHRQHLMYWHCFLTYGNMSRWVLPIDADEFVEAKRPEVLDTLEEPFALRPFMHVYLRKIEATVPAQIARWTSVLTNSRVFPPFPDNHTTLSEKYPVTCGSMDTFGNHAEAGALFSAKSVIQPRHLNFDHYRRAGTFFVHGVKHWGDKPRELFFNEPFREFEVSINSTGTEWTILHYWCRSLADYSFKRRKGQLSGQKARSMHELVARERSCRRHGQMGPSRSARMRQKLVGELLQLVTSYEDVQLKYYQKVSASLNNTAYFRSFMRSLGDEPQ